MYLICSWKRIFKLRPVWTTYDRYQVLHVGKFPICCEVECCGPIVLLILATVLLHLSAISTSVCLDRLAFLRMCGKMKVIGAFCLLCLLVCGAVFTVCGAVYSVCGAVYTVFGAVYSVCGAVYIVCGAVYSVFGAVYIVCGAVYTVCGAVYIVCGAMYIVCDAVYIVLFWPLNLCMSYVGNLLCCAVRRMVSYSFFWHSALSGRLSILSI